MFVAKATVLASLLALSHATVVDVRAPDLEVVKTEQVGNGTLSWFVAPATKRDGADGLLEARDPGCGTNTIKCSTSHAYYGPTCQNLINVLNYNSVADGYRAVCLDQGNGQCCISWSKTTPWAIRQKDLVPSAQRTLNSCGGGSKSGQEWNVNLGGTCLSQCLSNRPTGCK